MAYGFGILPIKYSTHSSFPSALSKRDFFIEVSLCIGKKKVAQKNLLKFVII